MKKILAFVLSLCLILTFSACNTQNTGNKDEQNKENTQNTENKDEGKNSTEEDKKEGGLKVIATLFPQYSFAKEIVKDKGEVTLLLPPGADSHSFEPSPEDIININSSDVFIYTGKYMEEWADRILSSLENKNLAVVDASKGINLLKPSQDEPMCCDEDEHEHEHEDENKEDKDEHKEDKEEHEHHHHEFDPHIWTSPKNAETMVDNILAAIVEKDGANKDFYEKNAEELKAKLEKLDKDFEELAKTAKDKTIVFGSRYALRYFVDRYGFKAVSPYDSCSAEAEPSAKAVKDTIDYVKTHKVKVVFYEELTEPKLAKSIADEGNAKILLFHSCHNLSKEDFDKGVSYIDLMTQNYNNLKEALE